VGLTGMTTMMGDAWQRLLPHTVLDGWVRVDDYVDGHGLVAMVRANRVLGNTAKAT
jgi:hypothetical protein